MELVDIMTNLKNWNYDLEGYRITKSEAEAIIELIKKEMEDKDAGKKS